MCTRIPEDLVNHIFDTAANTMHMDRLVWFKRPLSYIKQPELSVKRQNVGTRRFMVSKEQIDS